MSDAETLERPSILIIDDALGNIELIGSILGETYQVCFATHGDEGIELARRRRFDLILLDVVMPGINGFDVCKQLKAEALTRDVPIIFLTSLESTADEEYGLRVGAEDFIHKPISPPVVMARIRNQLLLAKARRDLQRHNEQLESLVAARTAELALRNQQLMASQMATITAFCALAEARDNETGNHLLRTQHYVRVLAERLATTTRYRDELDEETIRLLFKSAPLHDIGKVSVPDAILLKPGPLSDAEWVVMRGHCLAGRNAILSASRELRDHDADFLRVAADVAYCHHEKWNGSGYPRGLAGEDIPLAARLMAVADVYDALISRRVYKPPIPHGKSVEIIMVERGTHFDPQVIDAMSHVCGEFEAIAGHYSDVERA